MNLTNSPETPDCSATDSVGNGLTPAFSGTIWRDTSTTPGLNPGSIHVWTADLDSGFTHLDEYAAMLSDRETQRVARLKVELAANRYIVSRGILRLLLSRYTGLAVDELKFRFGHLGKPSLAPLDDGRTLSFNNTDSRDLAIYAFAWDRELGIDLERLPRTVRSERISRRRFASSEADALAAVPEAQQSESFLACWTRKEAWGKAIGLGIRYPMREIDLCSRLDVPEMSIANHALAGDKRWRLMQFRPDSDSLACLIAENSDWSLAGWRYTHDNLTKKTLP